MTGGAASLHPRLPVLDTAKRSFVFILEQRQLLALPFVALVLFNLLTSHLILQSVLSLNLVMINTLNVVQLLIEASFIVGVHRTILLNEARSGITFYRLDRNWARYLLTWFLIGIILVGLLILWLIPAELGFFASISHDTFEKLRHVPPDQMATLLIDDIVDNGHTALLVGIAIASLLFLVGMTYIGTRVGLSLPAAALGRPKAIRLSWRVMRGNVWRVFAICMITGWLPVVLAGFIDYPMSFLEAHLLPIGKSVLNESWNALVQSIALISWAAGLSLCYQILSGDTDRPA